MDIEEELNKISNDKDNLELYELFTKFTFNEDTPKEIMNNTINEKNQNFEHDKYNLNKNNEIENINNI